MFCNAVLKSTAKKLSNILAISEKIEITRGFEAKG
jgi:hypothetical protein